MMLISAIGTPTTFAWPFPVVIATKRDYKPRFCGDYRILNQEVKADRFPLPNIQDIFDVLGGQVFITKLDFLYGCWQKRLSDHYKEKTTQVCRQEYFKFGVMPFELMNALSTF